MNATKYAKKTSYLRRIKQLGLAGLTSIALGFGASNYGLDGIANGLAFPAGEVVARKIEKQKVSLEDITKQTIAGVAMTPVFQYGWNVMENNVPVERLSNIYANSGSLDETLQYAKDHIEKYAKRSAAIAGGFLPGVVGINQSVDHVLENKGIGGLYTTLKEKWWRTTKKVVTQVGPLVALNTFLVPPGLNVAIGSGISATYRIILALASRGRTAKSLPTSLD